MSEDKGGEYTKRLSQELKSSLYQRGQEESLWGNDHMAPADLQVSTSSGLMYGRNQDARLGISYSF